MKEYILNESAYKTTNNFKINNIKVKLDIPSINYDIGKVVNKKFKSRIGLDFNKYSELNYLVDGNVLEEITYKNNEGRVININIDSSDSINNEFNLILKSLDNTSCFSYININTDLDNKHLQINIINMLNDKSISLISYNNKLINTKLLINHIDLGSNIKINNCYTELYKESFNEINTIYFGNNKNILDYNYHIKNIDENTISNIMTEGVLKDEAYKQYKGIIDFIEGCKKSKGEELENCVLLTDKAISRSCPMLMCHEEDVEGAHGVSTGKIDKEKMFYLKSRGLTDKEATKLIVMANFNKVLLHINNEDVKSMIIKYIDNVL